MLYEGILSLFPYVSLVAPGKLQCALLLALAARWVSAERPPTASEWTEKGKEQKVRKGRQEEAKMTMSPSSKSTCADRTARCSSSSSWEARPLILEGSKRQIRGAVCFLVMDCLQKAKGHSLKSREINVHVHVGT